MLSIFVLVANVPSDASILLLTFNFFWIMSVLFFFILSALVLNYNWMFTSACIVSSVVGVILIFTEKYNIVAIEPFGLVIAFTLLSIYACYYFEKQAKMSLI